jgi:hypothetical protein
MKTTTLFRPVGPKELALIEESGVSFPRVCPNNLFFIQSLTSITLWRLRAIGTLEPKVRVL